MIDAVTLEVLRNRFEVIADEMQVALIRSSHSIILKEGADCSCALFTLEGESLAQACALPIHLGVLIPAVKRILQVFPVPTMREGDVYVLNDPYDGGTHLPDLIMAVPVFHGRRAVALSVNLAHKEDIGGKSPGSMPANATEIFEEGLILPPMKLYDAGRRNETLVQIIRRNVRLPELVLGDIDAQLASCRVGGTRLREVLREYGLPTFRRYVTELLDRAARLTSEGLARVPPGVYTFTDYLDNDGVDLDRRIPITATVTMGDGRMHVDFTGTSAQTRGPVNSGFSGAVSAVYFVVRAITEPTIPSNSGCYRPVSVSAPEGCLLNPRHPAPVCIRAHTLKRVVDTVMGALVQALPGRLPAAPSGSESVVSFGGRHAGTGEPYGLTDILAGGTGGRPGKDGVDAIETDITNCMNIPVEAIEAKYPLRAVMTRLRKDSGGAGRWRGGLGVERGFEVLDGEVRCSFRSERHFTHPWGLAQGGPGATWRTFIVRGDGTTEAIPSKAVFTLSARDRFYLYSGGGGGYGSALERPPAQVAADVLDGKVSVEAAERDYGVRLDATRAAVDERATARLRTRRRAEVAGRGGVGTVGAPAGRAPAGTKGLDTSGVVR